MNSSKKTRVMDVIGRLNVKYWHKPFGDTSEWLPADRALLEKAIRFYESL